MMNLWQETFMLHKRVRYNGRKGCRAKRRLWSLYMRNPAFFSLLGAFSTDAEAQSLSPRL